MYNQIYWGKKLIHSLHPSRGYVFGAFVYLFVFAITPTVTGDYVSMQCIHKRDIPSHFVVINTLLQSATGVNLLSHGLRFTIATKTRVLLHKRERNCFSTAKTKCPNGY